VHQELSVADNLTVVESMFLGREVRNRAGWIDRGKQRGLCAPILSRLGVPFAPETPMASLSIGQRQLVEIARALLLESRLIILDEPTSSLTPTDAERLFTVLRQLRERGTSILYVSHRLPEIEALCDRVVGLRDGRNSGELVPPDISGRPNDPPDGGPRPRAPSGPRRSCLGRGSAASDRVALANRRSGGHGLRGSRR